LRWSFRFLSSELDELLLELLVEEEEDEVDEEEEEEGLEDFFFGRFSLWISFLIPSACSR